MKLNFGLPCRFGKETYHKGTIYWSRKILPSLFNANKNWTANLLHSRKQTPLKSRLFFHLMLIMFY